MRRRARLALASSALAWLGLPGPVRADPRVVGVDAILSVPLAPWRTETGLGGGGSLWLHVPVSHRTTITSRLGAIVHADRPVAAAPGARARLSEIPLFGGARYRVSDGVVRGYFAGEVGLVFRRVDLDVAGLTDNTSRIRLASALGAGIEIDRFDVGAAVWLADLSDLDHEIGVIVSVGARVYAF